MIKTNQMKKCKDGYVWDPDAWRANNKEAHTQEGEQTGVSETEYQKALASWHLKCNMEKRFGHREWMGAVVDPDTLQWDEHGNRVRPKQPRTLSHAPVKQKRRLR